MEFTNPAVERKLLHDLQVNVIGQRRDIVRLKQAIGSGEIDKKINAVGDIAKEALSEAETANDKAETAQTIANSAQESANVAHEEAQKARAVANDNTVKIGIVEHQVQGKIDKSNIITEDDPRDSTDDTLYSTKRVDYMFNSLEPPGLNPYEISNWANFNAMKFDIKKTHEKYQGYLTNSVTLIDYETSINDTENWITYGDFYTFDFTLKIDFPNDISGNAFNTENLKVVIDFWQELTRGESLIENLDESILKSTANLEYDPVTKILHAVGYFECKKFNPVKAIINFIYTSEIDNVSISFDDCSWTGRFATYILMTDYYTRSMVNKLVNILDGKIGDNTDAIEKVNERVETLDKKVSDDIAEINTKLDTKANSADVYTTSEIDDKVDEINDSIADNTAAINAIETTLENNIVDIETDLDLKFDKENIIRTEGTNPEVSDETIYSSKKTDELLDTKFNINKINTGSSSADANTQVYSTGKTDNLLDLKFDKVNIDTTTQEESPLPNNEHVYSTAKTNNLLNSKANENEVVLNTEVVKESDLTATDPNWKDDNHVYSVNAIDSRIIKAEDIEKDLSSKLDNDNFIYSAEAIEKKILKTTDKLLAANEEIELDNTHVYSAALTDELINSIDPPGMSPYELSQWGNLTINGQDPEVPDKTSDEIDLIKGKDNILETDYGLFYCTRTVIDYDTIVDKDADEKNQNWRPYGDFITFEFSINVDFSGVTFTDDKGNSHQANEFNRDSFRFIIDFYQRSITDDGEENRIKSTSNWEYVDNYGENNEVISTQIHVRGFLECTKFLLLKSKFTFLYENKLEGLKVNMTGCTWIGRFATYILVTNYYTRGQVNHFLNEKADKTYTYTKDEVDDRLKRKANKLDTYSKETISDLFSRANHAIYEDITLVELNDTFTNTGEGFTVFDKEIDLTSKSEDSASVASISLGSTSNLGYDRYDFMIQVNCTLSHTDGTSLTFDDLTQYEHISFYAYLTTSENGEAFMDGEKYDITEPDSTNTYRLILVNKPDKLKTTITDNTNIYLGFGYEIRKVEGFNPKPLKLNLNTKDGSLKLRYMNEAVFYKENIIRTEGTNPEVSDETIYSSKKTDELLDLKFDKANIVQTNDTSIESSHDKVYSCQKTNKLLDTKANSTDVYTKKDINDKVKEINTELGTLDERVITNEKDITDLTARVTTNENDIDEINTKLDLKFDKANIIKKDEDTTALDSNVYSASKIDSMIIKDKDNLTADDKHVYSALRTTNALASKANVNDVVLNTEVITDENFNKDNPPWANDNSYVYSAYAIDSKIIKGEDIANDLTSKLDNDRFIYSAKAIEEKIMKTQLLLTANENDELTDNEHVYSVAATNELINSIDPPGMNPYEFTNWVTTETNDQDQEILKERFIDETVDIDDTKSVLQDNLELVYSTLNLIDWDSPIEINNNLNNETIGKSKGGWRAYGDFYTFEFTLHIDASNCEVTKVNHEYGDYNDADKEAIIDLSTMKFLIEFYQRSSEDAETDYDQQLIKSTATWELQDQYEDENGRVTKAKLNFRGFLDCTKLFKLKASINFLYRDKLTGLKITTEIGDFWIGRFATYILVTNYYTRGQVNAKLATKADKDYTYTKDEVNKELNEKADKADTYSKEVINDLIMRANHAIYSDIQKAILDDKLTKLGTVINTTIDWSDNNLDEGIANGNFTSNLQVNSSTSDRYAYLIIADCELWTGEGENKEPINLSQYEYIKFYASIQDTSIYQNSTNVINGERFSITTASNDNKYKLLLMNEPGSGRFPQNTPFYIGFGYEIKIKSAMTKPPKLHIKMDVTDGKMTMLSLKEAVFYKENIIKNDDPEETNKDVSDETIYSSKQSKALLDTKFNINKINAGSSSADANTQVYSTNKTDDLLKAKFDIANITKASSSNNDDDKVYSKHAVDDIKTSLTSSINTKANKSDLDALSENNTTEYDYSASLNNNGRGYTIFNWESVKDAGRTDYTTSVTHSWRFHTVERDLYNFHIELDTIEFRHVDNEDPFTGTDLAKSYEYIDLALYIYVDELYLGYMNYMIRDYDIDDKGKCNLKNDNVQNVYSLRPSKKLEVGSKFNIKFSVKGNFHNSNNPYPNVEYFTVYMNTKNAVWTGQMMNVEPFNYYQSVVDFNDKAFLKSNVITSSSGTTSSDDRVYSAKKIDNLLENIDVQPDLSGYMTQNEIYNVPLEYDYSSSLNNNGNGYLIFDADINWNEATTSDGFIILDKTLDNIHSVDGDLYAFQIEIECTVTYKEDGTPVPKYDNILNGCDLNCYLNEVSTDNKIRNQLSSGSDLQSADVDSNGKRKMKSSSYSNSKTFLKDSTLSLKIELRLYPYAEGSLKTKPIHIYVNTKNALWHGQIINKITDTIKYYSTSSEMNNVTKYKANIDSLYDVKYNLDWREQIFNSKTFIQGTFQLNDDDKNYYIKPYTYYADFTGNYTFDIVLFASFQYTKDGSYLTDNDVNKISIVIEMTEGARNRTYRTISTSYSQVVDYRTLPHRYVYFNPMIAQLTNGRSGFELKFYFKSKDLSSAYITIEYDNYAYTEEKWSCTLTKPIDKYLPFDNTYLLYNTFISKKIDLNLTSNTIGLNGSTSSSIYLMNCLCKHVVVMVFQTIDYTGSPFECEEIIKDIDFQLQFSPDGTIYVTSFQGSLTDVDSGYSFSVEWECLETTSSNYYDWKNCFTVKMQHRTTDYPHRACFVKLIPGNGKVSTTWLGCYDIGSWNNSSNSGGAIIPSDPTTETYTKAEIDDKFPDVTEIYNTEIGYDYTSELKSATGNGEILAVSSCSYDDAYSTDTFSIHGTQGNKYKFNISLQGEFLYSFSQLPILSSDELENIESRVVLGYPINDTIIAEIIGTYEKLNDDGIYRINFVSDEYLDVEKGNAITFKYILTNNSDSLQFDAKVITTSASWTGTLINSTDDGTSNIVDYDFDNTEPFCDYLLNANKTIKTGGTTGLGTYSANFYKGVEYTHSITIAFQTDAFGIDTLNQCEFHLFMNGGWHTGSYAGHDYDSKYHQLMYFAIHWDFDHTVIYIPPDTTYNAWELELKLSGPTDARRIDVEPNAYDQTHYSNPYRTTWTGHLKGSININEVVGSLGKALTQKVNASTVYTKSQIHTLLPYSSSVEIDPSSVAQSISFSGYVQACKFTPLNLGSVNSISISIQVQLTSIDDSILIGGENLDELTSIIGELKMTSDAGKAYAKGFQINDNGLLFDFNYNYNNTSENIEPIFSLNSFKNHSIEIDSISLVNSSIISSNEV